VGPYDADLFFPEYATAIEVDGKEHEARKESDEARDRYFARQGILTLRVPARFVWHDPLAAARWVAKRMVMVRRAERFVA